MRNRASVLNLLPRRAVSIRNVSLVLIALGLTVVETGVSQAVERLPESLWEMRPPPPPDWRGASVSADTARMQPGHLDFGRYDPEQCLRAVLHVQAHRYRHGELDTLRYTFEGDTLATVAVDTGRACSRRFHDIEVPVHQLGALIRLQLAVREDTLAAATASRWLAMDLSPSDRAHALSTIASAYITASPMRLESARVIIAAIDSMGPSMAVAQLRVHKALLDQWRRVFNTAEIRSESERILSIAEHDRDTLWTIEEGTDIGWAFLSVITSYIDAIAYEEGRQGLDSVRQRILKAAAKYGRSMDMFVDYGRAVDRVVGTPFPDVQPDWVINGGTDPQRPRAGRVTVVAFVPGLRREPRVQDTEPSSTSSEATSYPVLRRLANCYGPRGLDIVLVTQTRGYSVGSLVQTEEEELMSMENLYLKYQKIPATILVNKTSFYKRPDGRMVPILTPAMERFQGGLLIVDQKGIIRWLTKGVYMDEAQINAYVESLLSESGTTQTTPGACYEK